MQSSMISDLQDAGAMQSRPEELVRRWLPPGKYSDLYHVYMAHQVSHGQPVASTSTFFKALKESGWKRVLRFRPQSTHSECHHCHRLKKAMKDAKTMREHCEAADDLLRHLAGQWADRSVYWQSRARAKTSRDVLTMIGDGMDKSKYLLPRWTGGRAPKPVESFSGRFRYLFGLFGNLSDVMLFCCCCCFFLVSLSLSCLFVSVVGSLLLVVCCLLLVVCCLIVSSISGLSRPSCHVYACLLHGRCLAIWVSDPDQQAGSNFVLEAMTRTLDRAFQQSQKCPNLGWPQSLQIWADNTPKEIFLDDQTSKTSSVIH